jgi:hypothetical protein
LEQSEKILELVAAVRRLPEEAVNPVYLKTTGSVGCITAMNHPAWAALREDAAKLLQLLDPAIRKNECYFHG